MLDDVIDKVESAQKDVKTDNKMHFIDASDDKHDADDSKPRFIIMITCVSYCMSCYKAVCYNWC